jgi:pyridoxal 5'-phosphate synthase pdxT subunit
MTIGVLALQGDFEAHAAMLAELGAEAREIRTPADLVPPSGGQAAIEGLILPGGESTTMTLGLEREQLTEPLRDLVASGTPTLATCAGMIVLDREHLGVLDLSARRNAFGRQVRSFETDLELPGIGGGPVRAVFIRAPWVESHGPAVEVLAEVEGHPVAVRQGDVLAVAFHPELTTDARLHRWLLETIASRSVREAA